MFNQIISVLNEVIGKEQKSYDIPEESPAVKALLERMDNLEQRIEKGESEIKKMQNEIKITKFDEYQYVKKKGFRNARFGRKISDTEAKLARIESELFWQRNEAAKIRMEIENLDPRVLQRRL